jgi:hypothetical protein
VASSESDTKPRKKVSGMPILCLSEQATHKAENNLRYLWSRGVVDSIEYFTLVVKQPGLSQALGFYPSMILRVTARRSDGDCDIARRNGLALKSGNADGVKFLPYSMLCSWKHRPYTMKVLR